MAIRNCVILINEEIELRQHCDLFLFILIAQIYFAEKKWEKNINE